MKCHANYGFPKLWRYRPGPMNRTEKTVFLSGLFLVFGYPAFFILLSGSSGILIVYLVSAALFFILTGKFYCSRCIHFSCPLNRVKDDIKKEFMKYNHLTY
jgi:fatty acid desaturase